MSGRSMSGSVPRREFTQRSLQSLLTFSLLDTLCAHDAFASTVRPLTTKWVNDLNELAKAVKNGDLKQQLWQQQTEALLAQVELTELLRLVDFNQLTKKIKYRDKGETSLRFQFESIAGIPTKLVFGKQIFALKKGRSVVPHGHNNMATAFLILQGKLHGRHYHRVEDQPEHLIIRPTIDKRFAVGDFSTVTDYKDNVHWFTSEAEPSFIFNFHVLGLKTGSDKQTGRVYVDPLGERLQGGAIRAKLVSYQQVVQKYG